MFGSAARKNLKLIEKILWKKSKYSGAISIKRHYESDDAKSTNKLTERVSRELQLLLQLSNTNAESNFKYKLKGRMKDVTSTLETDQKLFPQQYEKLIGELMRKEQFDDALVLLEIAQTNGGSITTNTYKILIKGLAENNHLEQAFGLYLKLRSIKLMFNIDIFMGLLNSFKNCKDTAKVVQLMEDLTRRVIEKHVYLTEFHYNTMIKVYGHHKLVEEATKLIDLLARKNIVVGVEIFNYLLFTATMSRDSGVQFATRIFYCMRRHRVAPTIASYNHLLTTLNNVESRSTTVDVNVNKIPNLLTIDPNEMKSNEFLLMNSNQFSPEDKLSLLGGFHGLIEEMKKDNVVPDTKTISQLLKLTAKSSSQEDEILDYAIRTGIVADKVSSSTTSDEKLMSDEKGESTFELDEPATDCEKMVQDEPIRAKPNAEVYDDMLNNCISNGDVDSALDLLDIAKTVTKDPEKVMEALKAAEKDASLNMFEEIKSITSKVEASTLKSLIELCGSTQDSKRAMTQLQSLKEFSASCNIIDESVYAALISSYCHHGFVFEALDSIKEMKNAGLPIGVEIYNTLIERQLSQKGFSMAMQTLNDMEKDNVSPNLNTFGLLAKICDSTLQCEELVKKMKMFGLQLDAAVAEILLTNAAESKNLDFIHSVMRHLQMHEVKADGKLCAILDDFGAALKADISTNDTEDLNLEQKVKVFTLDYNNWLSYQKSPLENVDSGDELNENATRRSNTKICESGNCIKLMEDCLDKMDFNGALAILEEAKLSKYRDLSTMYRVLLTELAKCGDMDTVFHLLDNMHKEGVKVNKGTLTYLIKMSKGNNAFLLRKNLKSLRNFVAKENLDLGVSQYLDMVEAYGKHGLVEEALEVISELTKRGLRYNETAYLYLLNVLSQFEDVGITHCFTVWEHLKNNAITPNLPLYTYLLHALYNVDATKDQRKIAKASLGKSEETDFDENLTSYSVGRLQPWGGFDGIVEEMKNHHVELDSHIVNLLFLMMPNTAAEEEKILNYVKSNEIRPNVFFSNELIRRRVSRKEYKLAWDTFNAARHSNLQLVNFETFYSMAPACSDSCSFQQFRNIVENWGYRIDAKMVDIILKTAMKIRNFDLINEIVSYVLKHDVGVNRRYFFTMLDSYRNELNKLIGEKKKIDEKLRLEIEIFKEKYLYWQNWQRRL